MEYQAIEYFSWNFDGTGKNISPLLTEQEKRVWESALEYQDKRKDIGHAEIVTYFAIKLVGHLGGKREIIVPAAILHDIGWSQMTKVELDLFFIKDYRRYEGLLKLKHEEEGVKLARRILRDSSFLEEQIDEICKIIDGHDTRIEYLSFEDEILRAADLLSRVTYQESITAIEGRGMTFKEFIKSMESCVKNDFNTERLKERIREKVIEIANLEKQSTIDYHHSKP